MKRKQLSFRWLSIIPFESCDYAIFKMVNYTFVSGRRAEKRIEKQLYTEVLCIRTQCLWNESVKRIKLSFRWLSIMPFEGCDYAIFKMVNYMSVSGQRAEKKDWKANLSIYLRFYSYTQVRAPLPIGRHGRTVSTSASNSIEPGFVPPRMEVYFNHSKFVLF